MDIRYKSFVPRSKQDHRFDQLLQASSSITKPSYDFCYNKSPTSTDYSNFSQKSPTQLSNNRKKVNVVTFTPDDSNELISHNRITSCATTQCPVDNSTVDSHKASNSGNIPSILRTSRTSSNKIDLNNDQNVTVVDSASKLMVAKRKAAREVADTRSILDSKKKYSPIYTTEHYTKRAVSPEILRPEPIESEGYLVGGRESWSLEALRDMQPSSSEDDEPNQNDNICDVPIRQTFSDQPNLFRTVSAPPPPSNKSRTRLLNLEVQNINKSRQIINNKKVKVAYNPRPWQESLDDDDCDNLYRLQSENIVYRSANDNATKVEETKLYDFDDNGDVDCSSANLARNTNIAKCKNDGALTHHQPPTKKSYIGRERYAVIENVKEAHECQETGETQDLLDDVEYLIEGLKNNLPSSTRTLSIITLIGKCIAKSFRELLKAHGMLAKIFRYLDDAHLNESVAMCTAALFLVFSRDRQPRIFDDSSLALLLRLPRISKNQMKPSKENERVRDKIRLTLNKFHQPYFDEHSKGYEISPKPTNQNSSFQRPCACCHHLKLDNNITTEDLVVECLLQFSSRKCADWFKSLLRKQHGLDIICDQVTSSVEYLGSDLGPQSLDEFVMDRLYRLFNYMRFFEHMTFQNRDNQSYLIDYSDATLMNTLLRCLKLCAANLSYQPNGSQEKKIIQACLLANLRLLANISHDNEYTSNLLGSCSGLLKLIFSCLLHLPRFMSSGKRFDLSVLALALLINLVEHCSENRRRMAHVSISRKRVACLGKCGQVSPTAVDIVVNNLENSMEFSFADEVEDEDMDIDDDEDEDEDPNHYSNVDCESSDTKINILEALVKLFLRHDDRAKNNTLIEGEEVPVDNEVDVNANGEADVDADPKWRLVADKSLSRKNKAIKNRAHNGKDKLMDLTDSEEDDCSSDEGADVEFMISSKEEEEELQKKLSAAGQHMQDSVVSAYAALLIGCIIKSSHHYMERIRQHLPNGKFKILAFVLAKFLSILSLTSGMGHTGEESILEVVRLLEAQDQIGVASVTESETAMTSRPLCRSAATRQVTAATATVPGQDKDQEGDEDEEQDDSSVLSC